ncbi:MAG: hypothetical protein AcusKO_29280 [Acuticoccus sp.]
MAITWPDVLVPQRASAHVRSTAASGGRTGNGQRQLVFSDAGFWEVRLSGVIVANRAQVNAYRKLIAQLRQGESVAVPTFDKWWPIGADAATSDVTISGDVEIRQTEITLTSSGVAIEEGSRFSIINRLHEVIEITSGPGSPPLENPLANDQPWWDHQPWTDSVDASDSYTVKISPPLRSNYSNGQSVNFFNTRVNCVLENMRDGDLDLASGRVGYPSMTLIESFS